MKVVLAISISVSALLLPAAMVRAETYTWAGDNFAKARYGNWGGRNYANGVDFGNPLGAVPAADDLDALFKKHDQAYQNAWITCSAQFLAAGTWPAKQAVQTGYAQAIAAANAQLKTGIGKLPPLKVYADGSDSWHRKTPNPVWDAEVRTSFANAGYYVAVTTPLPLVSIKTLISPKPVQDGQFGFPAAALPDVDGDGKEDIAVGESGDGLLGKGRVHVYSGGTGVLVRTIELPSGSGDVSGSFVAGIPDVNGDARGDIVVGAPSMSAGNGLAESGRVYVYSGKTGAQLRMLISPKPEAKGSFGDFVAGISDLNGDGRGEIIVTAPCEDPGGSPTDAGRVYVFSGKDGVLIRTLQSPQEQVHEYFGGSAAAVPDADGDSVGDVLVGAPRGLPDLDGSGEFAQATSSGRAFLFSGKSGKLLLTLKSPLASSEPEGYFAIMVSAAPDVNGDGRGDLIVGAPFEDKNGLPADAGRVYVFSGKDGKPLLNLTSPKPVANGFFGFVGLSGMPDVNKGGRGDIVVGAFMEGSPQGAGRVYVFSGATGTHLFTAAPPAAQWSGFFGSWVTGLKDTNGDGRGEIVVSAVGESAQGKSSAGRVHIIRY